MSRYRNEIINHCIDCRLCLRDCLLLQEIDSIKQLAINGNINEYAFACMSCGLCETKCPKHLSSMNMLYETRVEDVKGRENQIISLTSPDREKTTYHL